MALSPRERSTAVVVGVAAVVLGLYQYVASPYLTRSHEIDAQTVQAHQAVNDRNALVTRSHELKQDLTRLTQNGLLSDSSAAESMLYKAVLAWTVDSGVGYEKSNPDRPADEGPFQVISYHFVCTGTTPQVAKLLSDFETAPIPVRLTEVQLSPRKEGTDSLTLQFAVSTLVLRPPVQAGTAAKVVAAAGTESGGQL